MYKRQAIVTENGLLLELDGERVRKGDKIIKQRQKLIDKLAEEKQGLEEINKVMKLAQLETAIGFGHLSKVEGDEKKGALNTEKKVTGFADKLEDQLESILKQELALDADKFRQENRSAQAIRAALILREATLRTNNEIQFRNSVDAFREACLLYTSPSPRD